MEKSAYIKKGLRQLSDTHIYSDIYEDPTCEVLNRVSLDVQDMLDKGQITEDTCKHLTTNIDRT